MSDGTVNTQIVDSVTTSLGFVSGQGPAQAFTILDTVMAETLGMAMHNAVMRQQAGSMVSSAAVTAACAKMLQARPPAPPPPPPPGPPVIDILPPGPPVDPTPVAIQIAQTRGDNAIDTLQGYAKSSSDYAAVARADLAELAQRAAPPAPPPPPSPPGPPGPPTPNPPAPHADSAAETLEAEGPTGL